ncbi:MAG TPA: hypothetical protein VHY20_02270, partial [Pirellulales bacterium]|nr:hypothetical protein [Pirellulales bacterium]
MAAPLASLVPDDAGLCFEVHHLSDHLREFRRSDLYGRLAALPPLRAAVGGRIGQLRQLTTKLEKQLGVGTETLWASVIGQEVLLAVWPSAEPGGEGPALFLVRSPKPEMLDEVFSYFVAEQRRAGKLEDEPAAIELPNQQTRVAAIRAQGKRPTAYLAVCGNLGVVSTSSQLVEQVLRNEDAQAAAGSSLAALPAYRAAQASLEADAAVRIFLNPRPWQAQFEAGPRPRDAREALVRDTLLTTWKASEYLVASLSFDHELRGEAYLKCDVKSLPEPSRSLVESIRGESTLAERI